MSDPVEDLRRQVESLRLMFDQGAYEAPYERYAYQGPYERRAYLTDFGETGYYYGDDASCIEYDYP